jgi:hypothetical protein
MDTPSQHVFSFLDAICTAADRIHEFGRALALEIGTPMWKNDSRLYYLGPPTSLYKRDGVVEQFARRLGAGTWIAHPQKWRSINFAFTVAYRADAWFVHADVEDESDDDCRTLWQSDDYWSDTLEDAIRSLKEATDALMQSRSSPAVAGMLEEIRRGSGDA